MPNQKRKLIWSVTSNGFSNIYKHNTTTAQISLVETQVSKLEIKLMIKVNQAQIQ